MSDKKFKKGAEPSGASAVNKDIVVDKRNKSLQRTAVLSVVVLLLFLHLFLMLPQLFLLIIFADLYRQFFVE